MLLHIIKHLNQINICPNSGSIDKIVNKKKEERRFENRRKLISYYLISFHSK